MGSQKTYSLKVLFRGAAPPERRPFREEKEKVSSRGLFSGSWGGGEGLPGPGCGQMRQGQGEGREGGIIVEAQGVGPRSLELSSWVVVDN